MPTAPSSSPARLRRELGVPGAVMLGLGSMVGTGVFVSIGVGAGVAGPSVVLAIALAALVATCNALSSAQLAARHPVSGGTYEYGYRLLRPAFGFTAGWMFLCAKSASAATAALGFSGYLLNLLGDGGGKLRTPVAVLTAAVLTAIVLGGIRRSARTNTVIVSVTLAALTMFVLAGLPVLLREGGTNFSPFLGDGTAGTGGWDGLLHGTALLFVAFTGYGRIATLGEEVREPRRTIPRAVVTTLVVTALLYMAVGAVAVGVAGAGPLSEATLHRAAPLEIVARDLGGPGLALVVALGAMTAMLGVLLNLILGLSRVALAMGRRGDLPAAFGRLDRAGNTPTAAVILVGSIIAGLAALGNVRTTWSFSAFTVLIYYAITNLAALRLRREDRLYPAAFAGAGLAACVVLAFMVDPAVWAAGLGLIAVGLVWHLARRR